MTCPILNHQTILLSKLFLDSGYKLTDLHEAFIIIQYQLVRNIRGLFYHFLENCLVKIN